MSTNPRQIQLLQTVQQQGSALLEPLAELLGVTLQTVRRDVQKLADAGLLTDAQPPAPFPALLEEAGVKLHIALDKKETP